MRKAVADLAASGERVKRFRDTLLAAAQKAAQGAEFAYTRGAIGVIDVLDARRQLAATRLEALAAHTDYAKALSAWNAAMGVVSVAGTPARPQH
jgi:cobalt-zinc-cadmium efflux system outer membrane protein